MTHNQIAYQQLLETQRHNVATESIAKREMRNKERATAETMYSNRQHEAIQWAQVQESMRHNQVVEFDNRYIEGVRAQETERSNRAKELLTSWYNTHQINELVRSHKASELLTSWVNSNSVLETQRANRAREMENTRHNVVSEHISSVQASAASTQASAAFKNAQTNSRNADLSWNRWESESKLYQDGGYYDAMTHQANGNAFNAYANAYYTDARAEGQIIQNEHTDYWRYVDGVFDHVPILDWLTN